MSKSTGEEAVSEPPFTVCLFEIAQCCFERCGEAEGGEGEAVFWHILFVGMSIHHSDAL